MRPRASLQKASLLVLVCVCVCVCVGINVSECVSAGVSVGVNPSVSFGVNVSASVARVLVLIFMLASILARSSGSVHHLPCVFDGFTGFDWVHGCMCSEPVNSGDDQSDS